LDLQELGVRSGRRVRQVPVDCRVQQEQLEWRDQLGRQGQRGLQDPQESRVRQEPQDQQDRLEQLEQLDQRDPRVHNNYGASH
jgi:hypothetical protein